jgi:3-hydroxybutyryl-CoA dehydrogenase
MHKDSIKNVMVVGAGVMGHGIAQVFAGAGYKVQLVDRDNTVLETARKRITGNLRTLVAEGRIKADETPALLDRISLATDLATVGKTADLVIEAVSEVPELKKEIFEQLDKACPANAIFTSNTSGLDVFSLAGISHPERLVATHFFAPAHIIPLVEVCPGPLTDPGIVRTVADLMVKVGKQPVVLKQFVPSFIVNRIQNYMSMAVFEILANNWATPDEIDLAVKCSLGVRLPVVGVVQLMDFTGLDLVNDISKNHGFTIPMIEELVRNGHLGAKTSKGFYDYQERTEEAITAERDSRLIKVDDMLERLKTRESI